MLGVETEFKLRPYDKDDLSKHIVIFVLNISLSVKIIAELTVVIYIFYYKIRDNLILYDLRPPEVTMN